MKNKILWILIFLSLCGLAVSAVQTSQHLRNIATDYGEKSFCSINETINCDLVDKSRYSKIKGFPISGLGILFYASLTIVLMRSFKSRGSAAFGFFMVAAGVLATLAMAYISFFVIKLFCLLCIALYVISLLLLLLFPAGMGKGFGRVFPALRESMNEIFKIGSGWMINATIVIAVFLIGIFVLNGQVQDAHAEAAQKAYLKEQANPRKQPQFSLEDVLKLHMNQAPVAVDTAGSPVFGNADARVQMVEFSDFECPFCKKAAEYLKPVIKEYEDDIAFHFVNFPLDKSCNPSLTREMHKGACAAARAGYCAGKQDKFWQYHDALFANQAKFSKDELKSYAQQLKLDAGAFDKCLSSKEAEDAIREDLTKGQKADIHGTPSIFINGKRVDNWNNPAFLKAVLDTEIKAANK